MLWLLDGGDGEKCVHTVHLDLFIGKHWANLRNAKRMEEGLLLIVSSSFKTIRGVDFRVFGY